MRYVKIEEHHPHNVVHSNWRYRWRAATEQTVQASKRTKQQGWWVRFFVEILFIGDSYTLESVLRCMSPGRDRKVRQADQIDRFGALVCHQFRLSEKHRNFVEITCKYIGHYDSSSLTKSVSGKNIKCSTEPNPVRYWCGAFVTGTSCEIPIVIWQQDEI